MLFVIFKVVLVLFSLFSGLTAVAGLTCSDLYSSRPDFTPTSFRLFEANGEFNKNYRTILNEFIPGDQICFNNCSIRFIYKSKLGNGSTTEVLRVAVVNSDGSLGAEVALRIPINSGKTDYGKFRHETPFTSYIDQFIQHNSVLRRAGFRVPKIFDSKLKQFVAVELVDIAFDLGTFFEKPETLDQYILLEAENQLYKFAQTAAPFEHIGDFQTQQLVFSLSQGWVLLDYTNHTRVLPLIGGSRGNYEHALHSIDIHYKYSKELTDENRSRSNAIFLKINSIVEQNSGFVRKLIQMCNLFLCRPI